MAPVKETGNMLAKTLLCERASPLQATAWIQNRGWKSVLLPLQACRDAWHCRELKAAAPQPHLLGQTWVPSLPGGTTLQTPSKPSVS